MSPRTGIGLHGGRGVDASDRRAPRIGVDSTAVSPSEFEHVIEVVGDAEQFLLAVVRRRDGMHQQVGFRCSTDDVAVAVGTVAEHRTGDVRAVAVKVFCIVATRAEAE